MEGKQIATGIRVDRKTETFVWGNIKCRLIIDQERQKAEGRGQKAVPMKQVSPPNVFSPCSLLPLSSQKAEGTHA